MSSSTNVWNGSTFYDWKFVIYLCCCRLGLKTRGFRRLFNNTLYMVYLLSFLYSLSVNISSLRRLFLCMIRPPNFATSWQFGFEVFYLAEVTSVFFYIHDHKLIHVAYKIGAFHLTFAFLLDFFIYNIFESFDWTGALTDVFTL